MPGMVDDDGYLNGGGDLCPEEQLEKLAPEGDYHSVWKYLLENEAGMIDQAECFRLLLQAIEVAARKPPRQSHPVVLIVIAILAVLDFVADKIPGMDYALHAAGLVIHPTVGVLLALVADSSAGGVHPVFAAICGLLLAGGTHGARAAVRPAATMTTGGLMNPVVSFVEDTVSRTLAVLANLLPVLAFALV